MWLPLKTFRPCEIQFIGTKSATDSQSRVQCNAGSLFSNDPELIELYHEVRLPLTAMMVTFAMAVFLERIPMTMGRTKLVMNVGLLGSWMGQVPDHFDFHALDSQCIPFYRSDLGMLQAAALL
jgi:hypothetical protein